MNMQLHALLRQICQTISDIPDCTVTGVTEDSRQVRPGYVFVARAGGKSDGRQFVADAKARGALVVITPSRIADCPLPQIVLDPTRAATAASLLANAFHQSPSRSMRCFAVTGTNGKTTTTYLLRELLHHAEQRCGMIGTVEIDNGQEKREAEMTTPAACDVADLLAAMRDNACRAAVLEASSHALQQSRLAGVTFAGAAFTNLTGDHLDYHKTMENYAAAKAMLFESLDPESVAVVNADDAWSDRIIRDCPSKIVRFGFTKRADYRAEGATVTAQGTHFTLHTPDGSATVQTKLIGKHNIENALTAAALAGEVGGLSIQQIVSGLRHATGAPGRLQPVEAGQPFAVLVDYAHTDDALENVLSALRPLVKTQDGGKLRVLFGCGGDRDNSKRPRMARAAEKFADVIYVTSDNPRTEDPHKIIEQILPGFSPAAQPTRPTERIVEPDRRAAIERIITDAAPSDIVLLAGKGHENYQIIGTVKHHFDDVEEARRVLRESAFAA